MGGTEFRTDKRNTGKNHDKRKPKTVFGRFKASAAATALTVGLAVAAPIALSGCNNKQMTGQIDKKSEKKQPEMKGSIGKIGEPASKSKKAMEGAAIEAVKAGNVQRLKELLDGLYNRPGRETTNALEARDKDGKTLLIMASANGDVEMVDFLLEQDVSIKEMDSKGKTALDYAVESNNTEITELISRRQKTLDKVLLKFAHSDLVNDLLDQGADPETTDEYGRTPLIIASSYGYAESVKLLLGKHRVEVDLKDKKGETALMKAARAGSAETIKLLILYGADRFAENNDGDNALMMVMWNGNEEAIKAMKNTMSP